MRKTICFGLVFALALLTLSPLLNSAKDVENSISITPHLESDTDHLALRYFLRTKTRDFYRRASRIG